MTRLNCHSCHAGEADLLEAVGLGLADRFDQPLPPTPTPGRGPRRGSVAPPGNRLGPLPKRTTTDPEKVTPRVTSGRHEVRTYDYTDEAGQLLYQNVRYEWSTEAGVEKTFEQRRPDGAGGWIRDLKSVRRVLRHLPAVIDAIAAGREIWLAEGEKDDEALNRALDHARGLATTNNNGGGGFADELAAQLHDAHVVLVLDRDGAGYRRGHDLHHKLRGVAASVRAVLPATTQEHSDAADHLAAGHSLGDFLPVTEQQLALLVTDADATDAARAAEQQARRAEWIGREITARLAAAETKRSGTKAAADERRYALRWAYEAARAADRAADKAETAWQCHTRIQTQLQQVLEPAPPAELTTTDSLARAEQAQRLAARLAEQAWLTVGKPMPAPVAEQLARPVPTARHATDPAPPSGQLGPPGQEEDGDGPGGDVLPFPGGTGGGGTRQQRPINWPDYDIIAGAGLVERKTRDGAQTLLGVLSIDAQVIRVERFEAEQGDTDREGITTVTPGGVAHYVIAYTHPQTGEQITVRVDGDRAPTCDWLADLGEMATYDSSSRGRARVWDAIRHISRGAPQVTIYQSTGWRQLPETGWTYIHAGGGITAAGPIDLPVRLPAEIDRIDLPAPIADPAALRALFDRDCRALTRRLPAHVGAVLAGVAYRAVLGVTPAPTVLYGVPGTYKSAAAALTMHHFGTRWERAGASTSMSGHGATINALPELWHHAKDALFFGDDFAPDKGVDKAAAFLSEVARMQYNLEVRSRMNMRLHAGRGGVQRGYATRTSQLLTSEVKAAVASGDQRLTTIDLAKGDIALADIIALDHESSRRGRATVMASLLAWMAADQPAHVARAAARAKLTAERRRAEGAEDRVAEPMAELEAGWELIGDFLVAVGAYTPDERDQLLTEIRGALTEAGDRGQDPDSPTNVGERCRQLIASMLRSGTVHATLPGGVTPGYPQAMRLGYRRVTTGYDTTGTELFRLEPRGDWVGAYTHTVHGNRLHVDPTTMVGAILSTARRVGEPLQATRAVIQRELAAAGVLRTIDTTTSGRPVTCYTCPVPDTSGAGGQQKVWDLDADRLFHDAPDAPAGPGGGVRPGPYPDGDTPRTPDEQGDDVPELTQDTTHRTGPDGPCTACGQDCSLYIDGTRIHLACWKATGTPPVDPAGAAEMAACLGCGQPSSIRFGGQPLHPHCDIPTATGSAATTAEPSPATPAALDTANGHPAVSAGRAAVITPVRGGERPVWSHSVAVIDSGGVYTPDGQVHPAPTVQTIADIAAIGEQLGVGHGAAPGLLILTEDLLAQLGLMPDADALTQPAADGSDATEDLVAARIQNHLAAQTALLASPDGWTADGKGLAAWTTIRRGERAFRLGLEPFVWIWDRRSDSPSPFMNLPDPAGDPAACWTELARRLGRLAELLGTPWSSSAGLTGAALFDRTRRRRERAANRAKSPADRDRLTRRVLHTAGIMPELQPTGQANLEGEFTWHRRPSSSELDAAHYLHTYDRRGSYLAPAGGADLPVGEPEQHPDPAALAQQGVAGGKFPAALWQITLPAWEDTTPAPHPDQRRDQPTPRWVTTPSLRLLLDHDDAGGAGYTIDQLQIADAWVWPDQARLLEPWYRQLHDALLAARAEEGPDGGPLSRAIKGIYTGYIGRMDSTYSANSARPWHHQPVWRANIIAAARGGLWRVIRRHQMATGRIPLVINIDEVGYLDTDADPAAHPPAPDTGALGKLKVSKTLQLTSAIRTRLGEGTHPLDHRLWTPAAGTTEH